MSKGFLKVAEELYKLGVNSRGDKREFAFRSAISRAYYGVLWYVRDFYNLKGTDLHGMARAVLGKRDIELKLLLDSLGKVRNYADYQENAPIKFDEGNTRYYIKIAKKIISGVRK
ncbi:MAG: hypothetical protein GXO22_06685 [Aquificae bacterium]|nr:hypothetical protein [Aquificota bacterium]